MSLGQYARAAWWNWNVMARTLAGNFTTDYIGGSWSNPSQDRTSRAEAVALSRAGSAAGNAVLALAKERLAAMPAFALTDRYDESAELLAHTFCWRLEELPYQPAVCRRRVAREKVGCRAHNITTRGQCEAWWAAARRREGEKEGKPGKQEEKDGGEEEGEEDAAAAAGGGRGAGVSNYDCAAATFAAWQREAMVSGSGGGGDGGGDGGQAVEAHTTRTRMPILWPKAAKGGSSKGSGADAEAEADADADADAAAEEAAAADRDFMERSLRLDLELYEFATELFNKRVAAMRADQAQGLRCRFPYERYREREDRRREERREQRRNAQRNAREQRRQQGGGHWQGERAALPLPGGWWEEAALPLESADPVPGEDQGCALRCAVPTRESCRKQAAG